MMQNFSLVLKGIATIFVILGSSGVAWYYCQEQKIRIRELRYLYEVIGMMKNEISYSYSGLPEVCKLLALQTKEAYQNFFQKIAIRMEEEGENFLAVWKEEGEKLRKDINCKEEEINIFLQIPGEIGYRNGQMQLEQMQLRQEALLRTIQNKEQMIEQKERVYLCLGTMGGLLCSIICW